METAAMLLPAEENFLARPRKSGKLVWGRRCESPSTFARLSRHGSPGPRPPHARTPPPRHPTPLTFPALSLARTLTFSLSLSPPPPLFILCSLCTWAMPFVPTHIHSILLWLLQLPRVPQVLTEQWLYIAGGLLVLNVLLGLAAGPSAEPVSARHPQR